MAVVFVGQQQSERRDAIEELAEFVRSILLRVARVMWRSRTAEVLVAMGVGTLGLHLPKQAVDRAREVRRPCTVCCGGDSVGGCVRAMSSAVASAVRQQASRFRIDERSSAEVCCRPAPIVVADLKVELSIVVLRYILGPPKRNNTTCYDRFVRHALSAAVGRWRKHRARPARSRAEQLAARLGGGQRLASAEGCRDGARVLLARSTRLVGGALPMGGGSPAAQVLDGKVTALWQLWRTLVERTLGGGVCRLMAVWRWGVTSCGGGGGGGAGFGGCETCRA